MIKRFTILFLGIILIHYNSRLSATTGTTIPIDLLPDTTTELFKDIPEKKSISISKEIRAAGSVVRIVKTGYNIYCYFYPTDEALLRQKAITSQIQVIKAQEALYHCLANNSRTPSADENFPSTCSDAKKQFTKAAGYEALNKVREEYKEAIKNLAAEENDRPQKIVSQKGMSLTKKIIIGSVVTAGVATAAIIAAPLVLPTGSIVALKAAAITTAAKSTAVAVAAKTAAAATVVKSTAVVVATKAVAVAAAMDTLDVINATPLAIDGVRLVNWAIIHPSRKFYYPTSEQELAQLQKEKSQRKSLAERIKEANQTKNNQ